MDIAIFGGSFDPPHIGHESIILQAVQTLEIDKLFVVPTFLNPLKKRSWLTPKVRLELLQTLCKDLPKVAVSDFEIAQNRATASIETIMHFKKIYNPERLYLIIGADNYSQLFRWKEYKKVLQEATIVVASRSGYASDKNHIEVDIDVSSTKLRQNLELKYIPNKIKQKVKELGTKNRKNH